MSMPDVDDRGDDLVETETEETGTERDVQGRFVKKPGAETTETEEEPEAAEEDEETAEAPAEEPAEDAEEEETAEEPEKGAGKDSAGRIRGLVDQRNKFRDRVAQLEAEAAKSVATVERKEDAAEAAAKARAAKLDDLYEKVEEARAEFDSKTAAKLQREIDSLKDEGFRAETMATARREAFFMQQNTMYDSMLDQLEKLQPVLDKNSEEFDERVVAELDFQVRAYEKMGMAPTAALHRASALLFVVDPFAAKTDGKAAPVTNLRRGTNVEKNVDTARRTPASTGKTATGSGKIDATLLSDEEFDKLPETKKRELRGDTV